MMRILNIRGTERKDARGQKLLCSIVPFPEPVFRACREIRPDSRQPARAQPFIRRPFSWPPSGDQVSALSWIPPHYHASGPPPQAHTSAPPRRSGLYQSCRPRTLCPPYLGSSPPHSRCSCLANHPNPPASSWPGMACKRPPVGVPPLGVTLLKMASTSAGVVTFLYSTLSRSFKKQEVDVDAVGVVGGAGGRDGLEDFARLAL
jgi:hypothetical protein